MMRSIKGLTLLLLIVTLTSFSLAVSCNPSSLTATYTSGSTFYLSTQCTNSGNSTTISITGETSVISTSETVISANGTKTINITLSPTASVGLHSGTLSFGDGSSVPIFVQTEATQDTSGCQINPSLVSYTQQVQQGTNIPLSKITFNPVNCQGSLILSSSTVSIQGGVITPSGQKPVFISSVESDGVNLNIDTSGLTSQTYSSKLKVSAFSKNFEIPLTIVVTGGTSGSGVLDPNNLPSCSVTAIELSLNNTYSLVCTNLIPDVEIYPGVDDFYIKGTGLTKEANQWSWSFKAKNIGTTTIKAMFRYLGAPIGDPYNQTIRITPSGNSAVGGITLKYVFYQNGINTPVSNLHPGEVIIQVTDNSTNNLVYSSLYVNGLQSNSTLTLEPGKNYELRASAPGYLDYVTSFIPSDATFDFTISPLKTFYLVDEEINISSSQNGTTFKSGDVVINSPYRLSSVGNITLYAEKSGFKTVNRTIEVKKLVTVLGSPNIDFSKWSKGDKIIFQVSNETDWSVKIDGQEIANGTGKTVEFKIEKEGLLEVYSGDLAFVSQQVTNQSKWYNPWSWETASYRWIAYIVMIIAVIWLFVMAFTDSPDPEVIGEEHE